MSPFELLFLWWHWREYVGNKAVASKARPGDEDCSTHSQPSVVEPIAIVAEDRNVQQFMSRSVSFYQTPQVASTPVFCCRRCRCSRHLSSNNSHSSVHIIKMYMRRAIWWGGRGRGCCGGDVADKRIWAIHITLVVSFSVMKRVDEFIDPVLWWV